MEKISIPSPAPILFTGKLLHEGRWGCGFDRTFGWMRVYEVAEGGYILEHRDSAREVWNAVGVLDLKEAAGFFGYCPRACTLYQALGIPVRVSA